MIQPGPLVIATHNRGKFEEFRALLEPLGFSLTCNADHGLPEPDETEDSFAGNALIKARAASEALGCPALSDDSGLVVAALDGAPGVLTADWAETPNGRDFPMAMDKLWKAIQATAAEPPFTASFECCLALVTPGAEDRIFEGSVPGQICWPPQGAEGHGFDPVFWPDGEDCALGAMPPEKKNQLSHRADAVTKFLSALRG